MKSELPNMDAYFAHPGVKLRTAREWNDHQMRYWYNIKVGLAAADIEMLLRKVPIGAYVQAFDKEFPSPSDPGAWFDLYHASEDRWLVRWSNHGWSSGAVPIEFHQAVIYFNECYSFHAARFLGFRYKHELMAHAAHPGQLNVTMDDRIDSPNSVYLSGRIPSD